MRVELYDTYPIRITDTEDGQRYVAADVCAALGISNPANLTSDFPADEVGIHTVYTNAAGPRQMLVLSLPGLNHLVNRSKSPPAASFQRWVNHDRVNIPESFDRFVASIAEGVTERIQPRRELTKATKLLHDRCVKDHYGGRCPMCAIQDATCYDHYRSRTQAGPFDTWKICGQCNDELGLPGGRPAEADARFAPYQWFIERMQKAPDQMWFF